MKKFVGILAVMALVASCTQASKKDLSAFKGTYLGVTETGDAAAGVGEMEITINENKIFFRVATGKEVEQGDMAAIADFEPMTPEEVKNTYKTGSTYPQRTTGFKGKKDSENADIRFLFLKDPTGIEFGLVITTAFSMVPFFNPEQIARGDYEKAFQALERKLGKGPIPRIRNGGK